MPNGDGGCRSRRADTGDRRVAARCAVAIREQVECFSAFTPENDPHGEHDFGSFDSAGKTICWKIDYYDRSLTNGSEDPSDARQPGLSLPLLKFSGGSGDILRDVLC